MWSRPVEPDYYSPEIDRWSLEPVRVVCGGLLHRANSLHLRLHSLSRAHVDTWATPNLM